MKRRHALYLTALIPVAILAVILGFLDPALTAAAGDPALTSRIQEDIMLFGAVGVLSVFITAHAVG